MAYGLTEGGYNSDKVSLTELGRRCVAPTVEGDDVEARNEAAIRPQILRQFFEKFEESAPGVHVWIRGQSEKYILREAARPVFELHGHKGRLKVEYPDCGHDFPPEMREKAYELFDEVLAGK